MKADRRVWERRGRGRLDDGLLKEAKLIKWQRTKIE
jgi:hypothetical protein